MGTQTWQRSARRPCPAFPMRPYLTITMMMAARRAGDKGIRSNRNRSGFSLLELLVVIGIIALLVTMLTAVIMHIRSGTVPQAKAKLTMKGMNAGFTNLKENHSFPASLPVGVNVSGETRKGTTDFADPRVDFATDGIGAGDEVFILEGTAQGRRKVTGRTGNVLHLAGASFGASERSLGYFVIRANGEGYPRIYPAKELRPSMRAWRASFTPHLNKRKGTFFDIRAKDVRDGWFRDPWGTPYAYRLVPRKDVIAELLVSAGPDRKVGTPDDIEETLAEVPFTP